MLRCTYWLFLLVYKMYLSVAFGFPQNNLPINTVAILSFLKAFSLNSPRPKSVKLLFLTGTHPRSVVSIGCTSFVKSKLIVVSGLIKWYYFCHWKLYNSRSIQGQNQIVAFIFHKSCRLLLMPNLFNLSNFHSCLRYLVFQGFKIEYFLH